MFRGVAQLVARGVWDAEVASSSLVAPTIMKREMILWGLFLFSYILKQQDENAVRLDDEASEKWKLAFIFLSEEKQKDFCKKS